VTACVAGKDWVRCCGSIAVVGRGKLRRAAAGVEVPAVTLEEDLMPKAGYLVALSFIVGILLAAGGPALAALTERVNLTSAGAQTSGGMELPTAISADGRYVAFVSLASDLVPGDTNSRYDVFVHDRLTGAMERVSVASDGTQGNDNSGTDSPTANMNITISANGQYVAFASAASNLVGDDTNGRWDVFLRNRAAGTTERVSLTNGGLQANSHSWFPSISADGNVVAFVSSANNLVAVDGNGVDDVFVRNRSAHTTELVSVSTGGAQANYFSFHCQISADGHVVAFQSGANNLVADDTNNFNDAFVRDLVAHSTECVSVSSAGALGNNHSGYGGIWLSADGRYVAFSSYATNLVPDGGNGYQQIYLRDRTADTTERISSTPTGQVGDNHSNVASVSADGRYVTFDSIASNLVANDTNYAYDSFVRDMESGATERVTVSTTGEQANAITGWASASSDARFIAFGSEATNMVPDDTNHARDVFVRDRADSPAFQINAGASCSTTAGVTLSVTCGIWTEMRYRNGAGNWPPWDACAASAPWTLETGDGAKTVCIQGRDASLNRSAEVCHDILLDTTAPGGLTISINDGAACVGAANVLLTLAASGADEMRLRNETAAWSAWEPYNTTKIWALSAGRGLKTVGFQCRDTCGNPSSIATDQIGIPTFTDVTCTNSAWAFVEALVRQGITSGCQGTPPLYCPYSNVTRAQMAVFLCKAAGKAPLNRATPTFADIPATHWAYGYVERLADATSWGGNPPTSGCKMVGSAKYFCPDDAVTREQMAKFLCLAAGKSAMTSCSGTFADAASGNAFCTFIERLTDAPSWPGGLAVTSGCACPSGYPGGSKCYCPKSNVTRGQMAVFLVRAFGIPM